jgi:hypothetical protein
MERSYGASPGFCAEVHCGGLVIGEIGGFKREISYLAKR